jgi:hypothetical protein
MIHQYTAVDTLGNDAIAITFSEFSTHLSDKIPETMLHKLYISALSSISYGGTEEDISAWIESEIVNDPKLNAISENDSKGLMEIISTVLFWGFDELDEESAVHTRALRSRVVASLEHDLTSYERNILTTAPGGFELELILRSKRKWAVWEIINQQTCPSDAILDPLTPFRWLANQYSEFDTVVSGAKVQAK